MVNVEESPLGIVSFAMNMCVRYLSAFGVYIPLVRDLASTSSDNSLISVRVFDCDCFFCLFLVRACSLTCICNQI